MDKIVKELVEYTKDLRVLVVEDDNKIREEIGNFLSDFFQTIDTAANGQEGLDKYKQDDYDIVISDIKMPVMDGMEMVKKIRGFNEEQAIIIISAHDESDYLIELINEGIDQFILKPLDNKRFLSALFHLSKKIVNERRLTQYKSNLDAIFKGVKDAIILVNKELVIQEQNKPAEEICGFPGINETKGKRYNSLMDGCDGKCIDALNETIKTKLPAERNRFECNKQDGQRNVASVTAYPLFDSQEQFNGCVMVVKDETRMTDLECELYERQQFHNIIGKSSKLQKVYSLIDTLADVQTTVLITGENGTGKGMVAEALHYNNKGDSKKPFVVVNCAALSDNLLESELFGHVKGAFTGAVKDRAGRFQMANGGTIFLDEIGDISNTMQLRLLRVLQEMEFEPVGDSTPVKVNVRIITATNQDLRKRISQGLFREDLYYRLKVVEINMPPLRERREDIPPLVDHFIERLNKKLNKTIKSISSEVQDMFMNSRWPGNIRELQHTLEHAFVVCRQPIVTVDDLPPEFKEHNKDIIYSSREKENDERRAIVQALKETGWNKAKAARLLGMSRMNIYLKIKKHNIIESRVV